MRIPQCANESLIRQSTLKINVGLMTGDESAEQDVAAGWGLTLATVGVMLAALALTLLPGIALANGSGRALWMVLGIVAFVVARAKLVTILGAVIAFVGESCRAREKVLALAAPRFRLAAVTVIFVAIAIPHC